MQYYVLASATILALLLTLLGLSTSTDRNLKKRHYKEVLLIAKIDTILIICAIVLFQFFNIPFSEAKNIDKVWFVRLYWTILVLSSLLSGGLVTIILMLFNTVTNLIQVFGLGIEDHYLIDNDEEIE